MALSCQDWLALQAQAAAAAAAAAAANEPRYRLALPQLLLSSGLCSQSSL
jgi:hypothetical protein